MQWEEEEDGDNWLQWLSVYDNNSVLYSEPHIV